MKQFIILVIGLILTGLFGAWMALVIDPCLGGC
jgi:hypothetical protein